MVQKRQAILEKNHSGLKSDDDDDAILQGKIVDIIFQNAKETIKSKNKTKLKKKNNTRFVFRRSGISVFICENSIGFYSTLV